MLSSPILLLHISGGGIGLLSGAVALSFRKGSRSHSVAGTMFFVSMLTAASAGTYLGFRNSEMDNVFGGIFVLYLLATAWVTARRRDGETGGFDWIGFLVVLAVGVVSLSYAIEAANSPTGRKAVLPASGYRFPISVALISAVDDAHMLLRGGLFGAQRIARHLLAYVLRAVHRLCVLILGTPTAIPRFTKQNTRTSSARNHATDIHGFLAGSRFVHKRIQENCPSLSNARWGGISKTRVATMLANADICWEARLLSLSSLFCSCSGRQGKQLPV